MSQMSHSLDQIEQSNRSMCLLKIVSSPRTARHDLFDLLRCSLQWHVFVEYFDVRRSVAYCSIGFFLEKIDANLPTKLGAVVILKNLGMAQLAVVSTLEFLRSFTCQCAFLFGLIEWKRWKSQKRHWRRGMLPDDVFTSHVLICFVFFV